MLCSHVTEKDRSICSQNFHVINHILILGYFGAHTIQGVPQFLVRPKAAQFVYGVVPSEFQTWKLKLAFCMLEFYSKTVVEVLTIFHLFLWVLFMIALPVYISTTMYDVKNIGNFFNL